jgi:hypothetical protein
MVEPPFWNYCDHIASFLIGQIPRTVREHALYSVSDGVGVMAALRRATCYYGTGNALMQSGAARER